MPLRQDGSVGTSSAQPATSITPQRTSRDSELEGATARDSHFRPERHASSRVGSLRHEGGTIVMGASRVDTRTSSEDLLG